MKRDLFLALLNGLGVVAWLAFAYLDMLNLHKTQGMSYGLVAVLVAALAVGASFVAHNYKSLPLPVALVLLTLVVGSFCFRTTLLGNVVALAMDLALAFIYALQARGESHA